MDNQQAPVQNYDFANEYNDLSALPADMMVIHKDFKVEDPHARIMPLRRRFTGKFLTNDPASFFDYVGDRAEEEQAEINRTFVDASNPHENLHAKTILNFGETSAAGHADDVALLVLNKDPLLVELLRTTNSLQGATEFAETLENFLGLNVLVGTKELVEGEINLSAAIAAIRNAKVDRQQQSTLKTGGLNYEASDFEKIELEGVDKNLADAFIMTSPVYTHLTEQQIKFRVEIKFIETEKGIRSMYALRPVGLLGHYMVAAKDFQERISTQLSNVSIGTFSC